MTDQSIGMPNLSGRGAGTYEHTGDEARARLKKRYAKEARFKNWGRAAIGVSVAFLVILLGNIFINGMPAFTYHFVSLPFDVSAQNLVGDEELNSKNIGNADFDAIVRGAIRSEFPTVSDRKGRRALGRLLSAGAPVLLREQLVEDQGNVGVTSGLEVPLSDFADLYLKGDYIEEQVSDGNAALGISLTGKTYTLTTTATVLPQVLSEIRIGLGQRATVLTRRAALGQLSLNKALGELSDAQARSALPDRDIERAIDAGEITGTLVQVRERTEKKMVALEKTIVKLEKQISKTERDAAGFDARAKATTGSEKLSSKTSSLLIYVNGGVFKAKTVSDTEMTGTFLQAMVADAGNDVAANDWRIRQIATPEAFRKFSDQEIVWTDALDQRGYIRNGINTLFFTRGASREAEMAGIYGAFMGSLLVMAVTLVVSLPLGVCAAIYLEEFAPKNAWTTLIEVNINNLAAVPSIVFGLLGLAVFINYFEMGRSAPLVGGLVLALMTLPTIIIVSRAAMKSVPPSIREAALGIGASQLQTVTHHVLPLAVPGILTGTIIGMARALGETAPLLMIGMVAFVVDVPSITGFTDPATVLPVQIYMWADLPEPAFNNRTSAAILVLLVFLILMNATAVVLRKKFERRW